jgi:N-formylglutamate deformylase
MTAALSSGEIEIDRRDAPLLVTFPHTGTVIPENLLAAMHSRELALLDTDWWIHELYDFVGDYGATTVRTPFSRSVIDVNRDPAGVSLYPGQATTGLVPVETFDGVPLYAGAPPSPEDVAQRRTAWFDPFHDAIRSEIERLKALHGHVVLYDCHSIRSVVPRLFEGELPIFSIGTNGGASCDRRIEDAVASACLASGLSMVLNGRFKGGWITRNYGDPASGVHAIQMELAQRFYMDEARVERLPAESWSSAQAHLRRVFDAMVSTSLSGS